MNIIKFLSERKILSNITNRDKFDSLPAGSGVYIGFDPTAKSLHLGNYVQIAILKMFNKAGYNAIALLGGATGMIGDPSGKSLERNLLNTEELNINKDSIKKQLESFGLKTLDNFDFYKDMNVLYFLRNVGKLLNVNYMINKEVVKSRLDAGISFTEFSYQLVQGWDFKVLNEFHGVNVQVGGSDQWGNITAGIEMIRKTSKDDANVVGITTELLTSSSGKKFGKSEGNALFLDKEMTAPFEIYQYLLNSADDDVRKLLLWLTPYSMVQIDNLMSKHKANPKARFAQKELAFKIIEDIHGKSEADDCLVLTNILFGGMDVKTMTASQLLSLDGAVPTIELSGESLIDTMIVVGASRSKREAREFISNSAIEVNGVKILDFDTVIGPSSFSNTATIIKRGNKKFFLIKH